MTAQDFLADNPTQMCYVVSVGPSAFYMTQADLERYEDAYGPADAKALI